MNNIDRISVATPQDVDPIPNSMKRNMDPIPVAIYVRVSSDRQDIHNSIEAQIDECTRYASAHNMIVVKILQRRGRQRENQLTAGIPGNDRGCHWP